MFHYASPVYILTKRFLLICLSLFQKLFNATDTVLYIFVTAFNFNILKWFYIKIKGIVTAAKQFPEAMCEYLLANLHVKKKIFAVWKSDL